MGRLALCTCIVVLAGWASPAAASSSGGDEGLAAARDSVVQALSEGRAGRLGPLLPPGFKVHLSLRTIGPARGLYEGGQLIVLLDRWLAARSKHHFRAAPPGSEAPEGPQIIQGTLTCQGPGGTVRIDLHFVLERAGDSWRLSEMWEAG
jgi:hypothetical protein